MISRLIYENDKKKEKIYGEANNPNTVKVNNGTDLTPNSFIIGVKGTRNVKALPSKASSLVMTNGAGEVYLEQYSNKQNQLVGTDTYGNFHFFPRRDYPLTPPSGTRLFASVKGSEYSSGNLGSQSFSFSEPGWYDIFVSGAGGGGGGGGIYAYDRIGYNHKGGNGGPGGYTKVRVLVTAVDGITEQSIGVPVIKLGTQAKIEAGCSGGGGAGLKAPSTGGGKSAKDIQYNVRGGLGGRSPWIISGSGNSGDNFKAANNSDYLTENLKIRNGGTGINGGAKGGSSHFTAGSGAGSGAGGGANGMYGGDGGSSVVHGNPPASWGVSYPLYSGAGGGAGGGLGLGGRGSWNDRNNLTSSGGQAYGGGGGGDSYNSNGSAGKPSTTPGIMSLDGYSGGGGGGGGGASYFRCQTVDGELLIIAGGGGGGAGCASGAGYVEDGKPGKNSVNTSTGGGPMGGSGNFVYTYSQINTNGQAYDLYGANGAPGNVQVVKLI